MFWNSFFYKWVETIYYSLLWIIFTINNVWYFGYTKNIFYECILAEAIIKVLSHHWAGLLSHRPAPSSCPAHAPELPAACEEEWSPHHPAVEARTQMEMQWAYCIVLTYCVHIISGSNHYKHNGVKGWAGSRDYRWIFNVSCVFLWFLPVVGSGCCRGRPPGPEGKSKGRRMSFPGAIVSQEENLRVKGTTFISLSHTKKHSGLTSSMGSSLSRGRELESRPTMKGVGVQTMSNMDGGSTGMYVCCHVKG